ncbi:MAG TPA: ribbon-helix-helix protein, CopG family [Candidatus Sulfotelmatobacter sp.]|nr:ribbon-helix-helix protein, CopG family [Candidatus Sulfotelmatobacter sp.]
MAGSSVLTLRLDPKLKRQLDRLSRATSRSRSFVAAEAIREYVALNQWQIEETTKALSEADDGDFASERDVDRTLTKWTRRAR